MNKLGFSLLIVLVGLCYNAQSLDCNSVIKELSMGLLNWLGEIRFNVPVATTPAGWTMRLTFDKNFTGVGVWDVWVTSNSTAGWSDFTNRENKTSAVLTPGQELAFNFRVNYGRNEHGDALVPNPTSLTFQGIQLCR